MDRILFSVKMSPPSASLLADLESQLARAQREYAVTCTVPAHPESCPECGQRVTILHLSEDNDAIYSCSQDEVRKINHCPYLFLNFSKSFLLT